MRDLRTSELAAVSGGTFGLLSLFSCFKKPEPKCKPEPKHKPEPKCDPKPKKKC